MNGGHDARRLRYPAEFKQRVADLYLAGASKRTVSRRFNVSRISVGKWAALAASGRLMPDDRLREAEIEIAALRRKISLQQHKLDTMRAAMAA